MDSLLEIFIFITLFLLSVKLLNSRLVNKKSTHKLPPSIPSLPIVGSLPFIGSFKHLAKYFMKKSEELGPIFTFKIGNRLCLVINNFELIEEAYVKNSTTFAGRQPFVMDKYVGNPESKGIVSHNFDAHFKYHQKQTLSILREFGFGMKQIMELRISAEVSDVIQFIKKKDGEPFNPAQLALQATSNVSTAFLIANRDPYEKGVCSIIKTMTESAESISMAVEIAPWLRFLPYFKQSVKRSLKLVNEMNSFVERFLEKVKAGDSEECFVSKYLEKEGENCDKEQLKFAIRDLLGASTDTTATTLLWALIFLANNQAIQKRLQKEIDELVPKNRLPTFQDMPGLPYVEATILEVMRIKTLAPLSVPRLTLDNVEIGGYLVPRNTLVFPNLYAVHMNPKYWKDPELFWPERFLDEDKKTIINKEKCIPFSLGRRSCLGEVLARQEIFQFVSGLVQSFNILPPENENTLDENEIYGFVMKPQHFKVRMISRID